MYRYYVAEKPSVSDVVMAQVISESEYGFNCVLLEYNNISGYLPITEIVKKYAKKHLLKINQVLPVVVTDVDDKIVSLSKLQYNSDMSIDEKYRYCTNIIKLLKECVYLTKKYDIQTLIEKILWDNNILDYKDFFDKIIKDVQIILPNSLYSFDEINILTKNFNSRIKKTDCEIHIVISLKVYSHDAINVIKNILNFPVKTIVNTASAPQYDVKILSSTIENGMKQLESVYEHIRKSIEGMKSEIMISQPKIIESKASITFLSINEIQNQ